MCSSVRNARSAVAGMREYFLVSFPQNVVYIQIFSCQNMQLRCCRGHAYFEGIPHAYKACSILEMAIVFPSCRKATSTESKFDIKKKSRKFSCRTKFGYFLRILTAVFARANNRPVPQ